MYYNKHIKMQLLYYFCSQELELLK